MRTKLRTFVALILTVLIIGEGGNQGLAQERSQRETPTVRAYRKAKPSVVALKVMRTSAYSRREVVGTGVIVDESGIVITNLHVVTANEGIKAVLADGTEMTAKVLVEDARHDLAILRLPTKRKLPALTLAAASAVMEGEDVIAIGHPYGYVNTVSKGIVSALNREITMPAGEELTGLIQVTCSINPGNSGGPLLNINGELIGINVAMRDGAQGIAFALNADMVKAVLAQHLSAANMAQVEHGLACKENVIEPHGVARQQVVVEDASQTALKTGDVIVTVGDRKVANRFDLERSLWGYKVGDDVPTRVVRGGKEMDVVLHLSKGRVAAADTTPRNGVASTARPVGQR